MNLDSPPFFAMCQIIPFENEGYVAKTLTIY